MSSIRAVVMARFSAELVAADIHRDRRRETAQRPAAQCVARGIVERKLEAWWSPEQISGWLAEQYPNDPEMRVSHETIYQSLFVQGCGALRHELHSCRRSGRAMRRAKAYTKGDVGQGCDDRLRTQQLRDG